MLKDRVVEWTRNYLNSFGGQTKAVIGISGGKDSTVAAKVCVEAVGADRVIGILMPQGTQHDIDISYAVCKELGIKYYEANINDACEAIKNAIVYSAPFEFTPNKIYSCSPFYSNTPARIRMTVLYGYAALLGDCRVVCTCNRSEDFIGYSTKWGDMCGDFAPLADLTVREVKFLGYQLGLPMEFIEKIPEDGLSGKTDEENFGFTYDEIDNYLLHNEKPDELTYKEMMKRHNANLHKYLPIPSFKVVKGE